MYYILIIILLISIIIFYDKKAVPIFLYHHVNQVCNIDSKLFEEHLKIIKKLNMKTLTISEYYRGNIDKNSILLTFDDGYYDNYKYVFPLLKKYNMKATIFLNTLYIKKEREKEPEIKLNYDANYNEIKNFLENKSQGTDQYMTWKEIREMYDSGLVDFQAHSHKHTAIFINNELKGITKKEDMDFTDIYLYGKAENNYPIFPKRGEYSARALNIKKEFFDIFKKYCEINLKKIEDKNKKLRKAKEFIDINSEYFVMENFEEYKNRIEDEFKKNKNLIEENIGNKVYFFCWPWGHRSKETIKILKNIGVKGFISTKKGTNTLRPNWEMIRRIELREYGIKKYKLNLLIARNCILGKIYGWLS